MFCIQLYARPMNTIGLFSPSTTQTCIMNCNDITLTMINTRKQNFQPNISPQDQYMVTNSHLLEMITWHDQITSSKLLCLNISPKWSTTHKATRGFKTSVTLSSNYFISFTDLMLIFSQHSPSSLYHCLNNEQLLFLRKIFFQLVFNFNLFLKIFSLPYPYFLFLEIFLHFDTKSTF